MLTDKSSRPLLRSLLFHFGDIQSCRMLPGSSIEETRVDSYVIIIITSGISNLYIDDKHYYVKSDNSYLITPGMGFQMDSGVGIPLSFYKITFKVMSVENQQPEIFTGNLIPNQQLRVYPFYRLTRAAELLYAGQSNTDELETFKHHLLFQEMIGYLLEHNLYANRLPSKTQSVNSTIHYLQNNYSDNITVKLLAELANMPQTQYSAMFKELTDQKPLDYLTLLRINHSKEWLLDSKVTLREIALKVGFTDEYYFNRRFRQTMGVPPRQYALSMRSRNCVKDWTGHEVHIPSQPCRVIYFGEALGDLLVLGVYPIGGTVRDYSNTLYKEPAQGIQDIGHPLNREITAALEPDLIIFSNSDERQYAQIAKIAPTLTYNSWGPLEERIRMLGEWFNKQQLAEEWLKQHREDTERMWQQLQAVINLGETASVFLYYGGKRLFVMGNIGLTAFLYHPSGFSPVESVQNLLNMGLDYKEINASDIASYAGNRIFMLLPDTVVCRLAAEEMMASSLWRNLPAVRNGYAYSVEEMQWNLGDAYSRERLLDLLPDLLLQTS